MNRVQLELHIEELILHGFAAFDRHRVSEAMKSELARLFAEKGLPPSLASSSEMAALDAGEFQLAPGAGPRAVGSRAARAVYERMSR